MGHLLLTPAEEAASAAARALQTAMNRLAEAEGLTDDELVLLLQLSDGSMPVEALPAAPLARLVELGLVQCLEHRGAAARQGPAGRAMAVRTVALLRAVLDNTARRHDLTANELVRAAAARDEGGGVR